LLLDTSQSTTTLGSIKKVHWHHFWVLDRKYWKNADKVRVSFGNNQGLVFNIFLFLIHSEQSAEFKQMEAARGHFLPTSVEQRNIFACLHQETFRARLPAQSIAKPFIGSLSLYRTHFSIYGLAIKLLACKGSLWWIASNEEEKECNCEQIDKCANWAL
jgi:hypothetical protein